MTPRKAIRQRCLDCSAYSTTEVRTCELADCPLHEHRMGKRPRHQRSIYWIKQPSADCSQRVLRPAGRNTRTILLR